MNAGRGTSEFGAAFESEDEGTGDTTCSMLTTSHSVAGLGTPSGMSAGDIAVVDDASASSMLAASTAGLDATCVLGIDSARAGLDSA